jgi:micrococcal nuclease
MDKFIRKAKVTRILDGDTFDAVVDLGYDVHIEKRFRLLECDTPERNTKGYEEATKYTSDLILDKEVFIQSEKPDVYGRYLAYVFIGETTLNKMLVENGHAHVYDYKKRKNGYK